MPKGIYKRSDEQILHFLKNRHSFPKGNTVRRGIAMTKEQRRRMSEAHKGLRHEEETKKKIAISQKGKPRPYTSKEKNANWKGGINPINDTIRKSIEYRLWREAVFLRDNWTCQKCGARGVELHAHHKKQFALYPELRFAIDNGVTLCKPCHLKESRFTRL